jgi:hypothetical protein
MHAGALAVVLAEQEIAVAAQEIHPRAGIGKGAQPSRHAVLVPAGGVVAQPRLEQVAEDIQRVRAGRALSEKLLELRVDIGAARTQVQVRNEQRLPRCRRNQRISTSSITTGSTGTF